MANISIFTDSTVDRTKQYLEKLNVKCVPLTYIIDDNEFVDEYSEENCIEFYNTLREGKSSKTSAVSCETFTKEFEEELQKGNDVFYTGLSGKLSATFSNAQLASENLNKKYPNNKCVVVDSISTTAPLSSLIELAVKLSQEGKTVDEIAKTIEIEKHNFSAWFSVDDLFHLKRGGRISGAAAAIGTVLNIKPILILESDGSISVKEKIKGTKKVIKHFVACAKEKSIDPINNKIYIVHTGAIELATDLENLLINEIGCKNIETIMLGKVVGGHVGPGGIIIVTQTNGRNY